MTRTIHIAGRDYTVEDEPRLNGEIAPHLYDEEGEPAGELFEVHPGVPDLFGAPEDWTAWDRYSAVQQILALLY